MSAPARPICNVDADCPAGTCELAATSPYYLGTILLQATGQSCGLFTIDLIQDLIGGVPVTTFLNDDQATKLPTPIVETLTIDIGGQGEDCNDNGEPDECETDCNQNGTPDDCDVDAGISPDCNNNRTPDECDIASGTSTDVFSGIPFLIGDGIPDECQVSRPARDKHRRAATR